MDNFFSHIRVKYISGYGRGRMFCGEVGQSSVEEINHIKKGGNYGWNVLEGDGLQCENCKLGNYIHCAFCFLNPSF